MTTRRRAYYEQKRFGAGVLGTAINEALEAVGSNPNHFSLFHARQNEDGGERFRRDAGPPDVWSICRMASQESLTAYPKVGLVPNVTLRGVDRWILIETESEELDEAERLMQRLRDALDLELSAGPSTGGDAQPVEAAPRPAPRSDAGSASPAPRREERKADAPGAWTGYLAAAVFFVAGFCFAQTPLGGTIVQRAQSWWNSAPVGAAAARPAPETSKPAESAPAADPAIREG